MNQKEIEAYCRRVYDRTHEMWMRYKDKYPDWEYGYNVLYGPPRIGVEVFFLSYQGAGDDRKIRKRWPKIQLYAKDNYRLGKSLQGIFNEIGKIHLLKSSSGSSVVFFQSPSMKIWNNKKNPKEVKIELEKFSFREMSNIVKKMQPKLIIAIGKDAFEKITNGKDEKIPTFGSWCRIVRYGSFYHSKVLGIPHLTGARIRKEDLKKVSQAIATEI